MRYLRTNTATRITVGPFLDKTDGVTPKTSLTVTACKLTLMVDTGGVPTLVLDTNPTASGTANDMVHVTGDDAGYFDLELAAANVNYLGGALLAITDAATHCPVFHEFMILPAMIYDALVLGTDRLDVNVTHVADTAQTAGDLKATLTALFTTALTEAYAADGAAPTVAQALCLIIARLTEFAISGTTLTAKKLDGATTAATFTLNDGTNPTAITRAS